MFSFLEQHAFPIVYTMLIENHFYRNYDAKNLLIDSPFKLIKKEEEKIIGYLFSKQEKLNIQSFQIATNRLLTVGVHRDYRSRGHSASLFEVYDYYTKKNSLFNVVTTYATKLFNAQGYFKVYDLIEYSISRKYLMNVAYRNVYETVNAEHLLDVYQRFTEAFKNYTIRDLTYFEKMLQYIKNANLKVIAYYHNENCQGYAVYYPNKAGVCKVVEMIYLNTTALKSLLSFISENFFDVVVTVTQYEPLHQLFKDVIYKKDKSVMLRINHITLFNKLFHKKAKLQNELIAFFSGKNYFQDFYN